MVWRVLWVTKSSSGVLPNNSEIEGDFWSGRGISG